jgi:transcriptional regulator with XRE-family HTH domain
MSNSHERLPYRPLGAQLRDLRERSQESVAEVSGAVEIDERHLDQIEAGTERPTEDILLLLINHFAVGDDKAAELWQLAGYDRPSDDEDDHPQAQAHDQGGGHSAGRQTLMVMIDPRIMYSDSVEVVADNRGVVLSFAQAAGQHGQPLTVARIGMSREQAKMVMGIIHQALYDLDNPDRRRLGDGNGK